MIHLKIYEDYFGDEEYVNKKDLKFLDDLLSTTDLNNEEWYYSEDHHNNFFTQEFKKYFSFTHLKKSFNIIKKSKEPKTILDSVKKPYYKIFYDGNELDISQEKCESIFNQLMREKLLKSIEADKMNQEEIEDERENDIQEILKKTVKKYNL